MFVCAFDIRQFSLRMVLAVKDPVPIFLEAQRFQFPIEPALVLTTLETWADFYENVPDYLVGCQRDPWPDQLIEVLHNAGYRITWVDREDIDTMITIWKSLRPDARWLRGGLMAYLCDPERDHHSSDEILRVEVLEWIYATLRQQIMELEGELFAEGRDMCPGHLINECPLCDNGYKEVGPE